MTAPSTNRTSAAVDRREWQAARRAVLVQCDRCLAKGSGRLNARRRVTSVDLAAKAVRPGRWVHAGCGGTFVAYDIEVRP